MLMQSLTGTSCSKHPSERGFHTCPRCDRGATLYRRSEKERERIGEIQAFLRENPDAEDLPEAESVLVDWEVDAHSITEAMRRCNSTVWRLAEYRMYENKRILLAKVRDFLLRLTI